MWEMKVSLLLCVCWALVCTQLAGCGDQANSVESDPAVAVAAGGEAAHPTPSDSAGAAAAAESPAGADCPELSEQPTSCGQISIQLKGPDASCHLLPTANDLTRSPHSVSFDCTELVRGPNGYEYDALEHLTLMGDTCEALQAGGPHRVTLIPACGPG